MKQKIISGILAITIMLQLAGCTKEVEKEDVISELGIETALDDDITQEEHVIKEERVISGDMLGKSIEITEFINKLNDVEIMYNHSEYYYNEEDYQKIMEVLASNVECQHIGEETDYSNVYQEILYKINIQNNNDIRLCQAIIDAFMEIYGEENNIENMNVGDDFCKLKDLKVRYGYLYGLQGKYNEESNEIVIDYEACQNYYSILVENYSSTESGYNKDFEEHFKEVVYQLINQARQHICECRKEAGQINTTIEVFEKADSVLLEASSISPIYNTIVNDIQYSEDYTHHYPSIFEREDQADLLLLGIFKDGFTIDKYYNAVFNSDLSLLYDLFELDSKEDFISFYNILYAISTLRGTTDLAKDLNTTYAERFNEVGASYRVEIFKLVIKDYIEKINKENIKLSEVLKMYNFVKAYIINGQADYISENDELRKYYDEQFMNSINSIESIFFEYISKCYEISKTDINQIESGCISVVDYLNICTQANKYDLVSYDLLTQNKYLIDKYPLITELTFCHFITDLDIYDFDEATRNGYIIRERHLD